MSDDLVKRLRFGSLTTMGAYRMNLEAADRIEELQAQLAEAKDVFEFHINLIDDHVTQNEIGVHRLLLDGEYHTGPIIDWIHTVLFGLRDVNAIALKKLKGTQDE